MKLVNLIVLFTYWTAPRIGAVCLTEDATRRVAFARTLGTEGNGLVRDEIPFVMFCLSMIPVCEFEREQLNGSRKGQLR